MKSLFRQKVVSMLLVKCLPFIVLVGMCFSLPYQSMASSSMVYNIYNDRRIPYGADIYVWEADNNFGGDFTTVTSTSVPEGQKCLQFNVDSAWGGWGVFFVTDPLKTTRDLSFYRDGVLRFFVKTTANLKIEMQSDGRYGPKKTVYLSQYNWDGTDTWQEINIPLDDFLVDGLLNIEEIYSPFMITSRTPAIFAVDNVRFITQAAHLDPSKVEIVNNELYVNDEPFVIRGVNGGFIPIGKQGNYYDWSIDPVNYTRDIQLLRELGVNVVRIYTIPSQTEALLEFVNNGIYIIPTYPVSGADILDNPEYFKEMFLNFVEEWMTHPAVLAWCIGNEVNHPFVGPGLDPDEKASWYRLLNECAQLAHTLETNAGLVYHPVTTANAEIDEIGRVDLDADDNSMGHLDFWSTQSFRGKSFGSLFSDYILKSSKPLLISEFGCDAWDNKEGIEDQDIQSEYIINQWQEIRSQVYSQANPAGMCLGGIVFQWRDNWWKYDQYNEASWDDHNTEGSWANPGYEFDWEGPETGNMNEEWWGIVAIEPDPNNPGQVILNPRVVYNTLQNEFLQRYTLNLVDVPWYSNIAPYNSTGASVSQMILNYIREGAGISLLEQDQIYEYAKDPDPRVSDLTPDEVDKVLGHFDPYDVIVSNEDDTYDSLPGGNPYQGYNFAVEAYDTSAMNEYMRDICHWMDFTVTQEAWWKSGELVARPNTPAAIPLFGSSDHWVIVKGFATDTQPCPTPLTNPYYTPDFTVFGFWIKDPLVNGIGKDTYKTASECASTYFRPLSLSTSTYNGKLIQVAEPPASMSVALVKIHDCNRDMANLRFIGVDGKIETKTRYRKSVMDASYSDKLSINKKQWKDLVDEHLLSDYDAVNAFEGMKMGNPIYVKRIDKEDEDYYLVPFGKHDKRGEFMTSGVIILDAYDGHFKEASWTKKPERYLQVKRQHASRLLRQYIKRSFSKALKKLSNKSERERRYFWTKYRSIIRQIKPKYAELVWEVGSYSYSPYKPFWSIMVNGSRCIITQDRRVVVKKGLLEVLPPVKKSALSNNRTKDRNYRLIW